jgi:hypothetical protein
MLKGSGLGGRREQSPGKKVDRSFAALSSEGAFQTKDFSTAGVQGFGRFLFVFGRDIPRDYYAGDRGLLSPRVMPAPSPMA